MKRRRVLIGGGTGIATLLAGCVGSNDVEDGGASGDGTTPTATPGNSSDEPGSPGGDTSDETETPGEGTGDDSSDGDGSGDDGTDEETYTPQAAFDFRWEAGDSSEPGTLTVTHVGGDNFDAENTGRLAVVGDGVERQWFDGSEKIAAGDAIEVSGAFAGEEVRVVWTAPGGDTSQVIAEFAVPESSRGGPTGDGGFQFYASPTDPAVQMPAQYDPIQERLAGAVDGFDDVSLQYPSDYATTLADLESGQSHVAELGPFATGLGIQNNQCDVLLQRYGYGAWTYASVIVTTEDQAEKHGIESLADLEGKSVAFADPLSASGSLFPLQMLSEAGLSVPDRPGTPAGADFKPAWSNHADAFDQVWKGDVAACGVGRFMTVRDRKEGEDRWPYKEGVVELGIIDDIPRAPIAGSPELDAETRDQVVEAFVEADDSLFWGGDGEDATEDDIWYSDAREADADAYQPMVDMVEELGYSADLF